MKLQLFVQLKKRKDTSQSVFTSTCFYGHYEHKTPPKKVEIREKVFTGEVQKLYQ